MRGYLDIGYGLMYTRPKQQYASLH